MQERLLKHISRRRLENELLRLHRILCRKGDRSGGLARNIELHLDLLSAPDSGYVIRQTVEELLPGEDVGRGYGDFGGRESARAMFAALHDVAALLDRLS